MEGRCFSCASKFSIFKKECGCKSCRHSFCAGCLAFTATLPAYGNSKQKICKKCHDNISSAVAPRNDASKWSPPENYKKRMAALEARQSEQKDTQRGEGALHAGNTRYQGLSPEDQAISERLAKLKQDTKPKAVASLAEIESRMDEALRKETQARAPSLQEMEERLAVLQGRTLPSTATKLQHQPPDVRSQMQKVDDLLTQLKDEVAIDQNCDPDAREILSFYNISSRISSSSSVNDLSKTNHVDNWMSFNTKLYAAHLEREKDKILREAATELQDENTRQEKMLEIAKRLAALQGRDPDKDASNHSSAADLLSYDCIIWEGGMKAHNLREDSVEKFGWFANRNFTYYATEETY
ncbi:unnamed protein product [Ranitomeya imitator]|uniref:FYVE-type domain-containing protein n=1 Tax=Ranitomeya imitator TaxID=111125 RepID=A0ABN9LR44_9NEOB|nr:unnamed protein product [Ranitomeya imitator]